MKSHVINFLICGGIAAGANFGSRFLFSEFFPFEVAVILAFFFGLTVGFLLMRSFAFAGGEKPIMQQFFFYTSINFLALAQTLLISSLLVRWWLPFLGIFDNAEAWGHLVGVLVPVVTSYYGHRFITFR